MKAMTRSYANLLTGCIYRTLSLLGAAFIIPRKCTPFVQHVDGDEAAIALFVGPDRGNVSLAESQELKSRGCGEEFLWTDDHFVWSGGKLKFYIGFLIRLESLSQVQR